MYLCDQMWTRTYKLRRTSRWKVWQQTKWMQGRERERDSSEREGGRVVGQQTKRAEVLLGLGQTAFSYKVLRGDTTNTTAATAEGPQSGLRQYFWDWATMMRNMTPKFWTAGLLIARQTQSGQIDRTQDSWVLKDNVRQTNTELSPLLYFVLNCMYWSTLLLHTDNISAIYKTRCGWQRTKENSGQLTDIQYTGWSNHPWRLLPRFMRHHKTRSVSCNVSL